MIGNRHGDSFGEFYLAFLDEAVNEFHGVEDLKLGADLRIEALEGMVAIRAGGDHCLHTGS